MGKLIVFEGTDGTGKSTQFALLTKRLQSENIPFRRLQFPQYLEPSSALIRMYLNGEDVTALIREPEISICASDVSSLPAVRSFLLEMQRRLAREHNVVMDGRDIGTTVFPHAELKIFVTASAETRAQRRVDELKAKGVDVDFDEVVANINKRDHIDQTRKESPLRKADDAIELDNSHMTIAEQDAWLMTRYRETVEKLR